MRQVKDIYSFLCEEAPLELQMSFDNSGLQIGRLGKEVSKVLLALDVTDNVLKEAEEIGAELIISHHPLIFKAVKSISDIDPESARLLKLIENGMAVISMHTNLDIAQGGVNDVLIKLLGAEPEAGLDSANCGRVGTLKEAMGIDEFIALCRSALNVNGIRYYDAGKAVKHIAVMGGAGADSLDDAYAKGCDTYITSDIKYHQFLRAAELEMNLIDADHYCTENPIMAVLCGKLQAKFPDISFCVSEKHHAVIKFA